MTQGEKLRASLAAQQAKFSKQVIKIGDFTIKRLDAMNWVLARKGSKDESYYGRLIDALKSVPHKALEQAQLATLADVLEVLKEIEKEIRFLNISE